jgi:valyl-tRNA synthetase
MAMDAVTSGKVKFTPERYAKTYLDWLGEKRDWCISRQLWWGHRIPAWHCGACGEITVALDTPDACVHCGCEEIVQETDVLDTWFSSGLLPFTVFGWNGSNQLTPDLAVFYPTQLLVTGFDILFFWVARMIMLGCHFMLDVPLKNGSQPGGKKRDLKDAVPFREVYIHALVRDANREKMSKTKGNVIDPIEIITKYGTDAVRFTLASQASPGTDIAFNEARTEGYRAFANKIWNAARFLQMNIERGRETGYSARLGVPKSKENPTELPDETPLETRWIFSALSVVAAEVERALADYRFDEAANAVYQFFWGEFCDWYLELVKLRLNFDAPNDPDTALALNALVTAFEAALRLLSPFMPFLTEELWHALYASTGQELPAKSIALTRYPVAGDFPHSDITLRAMQDVQQLIVTIRALRKDLSVPEKEAVPIQLHTDLRITALAEANADMLARMARVSAVEMLIDAPTGNNARSTANFDVAIVYEKQIDVAAERERHTKELAKLNKGIEAAEKQLNNEGFIARAPAHIVEGLRKQHVEMLALKKKVEAALAALPPE